jgi:hypothetical protein
MGKNPDFIGIGGSRCGTTWLWGILRRHPETALPHRKELHYFDRDKKYPTSSGFYHRWWVRRLLGKSNDDRLWRRQAQKRLRINYKQKRRLIPFLWELRYLFGHIGDRWYRSLFPNKPGKITGEITPVYAILEREDVLEIKTRFPDLKVLFMVRDPVDRVWSQIRKKGLDFADIGQLREAVANQTVVEKTNYIRTIDIWQGVFGDHFYLCFYEDLVNKPEELFEGICRFLGISYPPQLIHEMKNVRIKPAPVYPLPPELAVDLAGHYLPMVREMATRYDGVPRAWQDRLEAIVDGHNH